MQKSMIELLSIADCISLLNAVFGFLSITMVFIGEIRLGFIFILLAILADGLDGIVARKTKQSKLGEYFESMADMTSLGIAPAFFVFSVYYNNCSCVYTKNILFIGVLVVYLSLSIIRLASFHIMKEKDFFVGLPASSSTIIILVLAYLDIRLLYVLPVILLISFLMISNIRFPKPSIKINIVASVLIFLTIIFDKNIEKIAPIILVVAICLYSIFGPLYLYMNNKKK